LISETRDPVEVRSQLLNVLQAGRDTTASSISWLLLCLSRNSSCYVKPRKDILCHVGSDEQPFEITFESLRDCKYFQHCIFEALRSFPSVSCNARWTNKDTILPD
jgi:cytochrome P450